MKREKDSRKKKIGRENNRSDAARNPFQSLKRVLPKACRLDCRTQTGRHAWWQGERTSSSSLSPPNGGWSFWRKNPSSTIGNPAPVMSTRQLQATQAVKSRHLSPFLFLLFFIIFYYFFFFLYPLQVCVCSSVLGYENEGGGQAAISHNRRSRQQ